MEQMLKQKRKNTKLPYYTANRDLPLNDYCEAWDREVDWKS